jgi:hypothetical protein
MPIVQAIVRCCCSWCRRAGGAMYGSSCTCLLVALVLIYLLLHVGLRTTHPVCRMHSLSLLGLDTDVPKNPGLAPA